MAVNSNVNPNFPIPGIDQSSRGFRNNFATTKEEIENLQSKNIRLSGIVTGGPVQIGDGTGDIVIPTALDIYEVPAAGSNLSVQINKSGILSGSNTFINGNKLGINTSTPAYELHVIGNANVAGTGNTASLLIGSNLEIRSEAAQSNISINGLDQIQITSAYGNIGIGTTPTSTFDVYSINNDVAIFRAGRNTNDNAIRFTTGQNATFGLVLEQTTANKVGGMRIDQNGNISIHVNESSFANLSDASRIINILPNNNVGIGSMTPQSQLDVQGNVKITGLLQFSNVDLSSSSIFFADGSSQSTGGGGGVTASGTRSLSLGDVGRYIISTTAGSETITIPNDTSLAFPVGGRTSVILNGSGTVTISPEGPAQLYLAGTGATGNRTLAAYGFATLVKIASNTWFISGNGIT